MTVLKIVFAVISFAIAIFAFGIGIAKLFKNKKPLYLQLFVCAAGCIALQQLSFIVNILCNITAAVSIGMLGILGCNLFLFSANYGTIDKTVDDGVNTKKPRIFSAIAPIIMVILVVISFLAWKEKDMFCAIMWIIVLVPALPASYFNLKHILLPIDSFGFLKATRFCNIAALSFYIVTAVYAICSALGNDIVSGVLSLLMALLALALSLCAIKGEKKWGI